MGKTAWRQVLAAVLAGCAAAAALDLPDPWSKLVPIVAAIAGGLYRAEAKDQADTDQHDPHMTTTS